MKTLTVLVVGCSALAMSALAAPSAMASHYPLDTISSGMMSAAQAATLGVAANHTRDFEWLSGSKESPDPIWLCDLAGTTEVTVAGPPEVYSLRYASGKSKVETSAAQELDDFGNEQDARTAMRAIRKAATKCSGTFKVKDDQGWTVTQTLINGTGTTAEGKTFVWVKTTTTQADATTSVSEMEYNTYSRAGSFIQTVEVQELGLNAPKITSAQIRTVNKLTGTLGTYWMG
ncbi:MAG: hypothetical protein B7C55_02790 [Actinomycetales bacterium mxb001]|nr:MAG: hypothetical protein B7C55_02790 [Actinomycetales bacterium mxb001]